MHAFSALGLPSPGSAPSAPARAIRTLGLNGAVLHHDALPPAASTPRAVPRRQLPTHGPLNESSEPARALDKQAHPSTSRDREATATESDGRAQSTTVNVAATANLSNEDAATATAKYPPRSHGWRHAKVAPTKLSVAWARPQSRPAGRTDGWWAEVHPDEIDWMVSIWSK